MTVVIDKEMFQSVSYETLYSILQKGSLYNVIVGLSDWSEWMSIYYPPGCLTCLGREEV